MDSATKNGITFSRESFTDDLAEEAIFLAELHNKEIGGVLENVSVKIPKELYKNLDQSGLLKTFCVRKDGKLMGYNVFTSMNHPQYNVLSAQHDSMYLHPSVRSGFNAVKFLRWCDEMLKNDGVVFVTQNVTVKKDFSSILKRIGYEPHETIYIKKLN
jgi:hypothetical protein